MKRYDVIIVGAGPAGLSAAVEAAQAGMEVLVIDENQQPGGQLFKQIHKFFGSKEHKARIRGFKIGQELLEQAQSVGVMVWLDTIVMGLFPQLGVTVMRDRHISHCKGDAVILATGASENGLPFPGWTLPGVMGAGAAQTLMNLHREQPGQKILMVGTGNVGLVVSYQLLEAGCEVVALIDVLPRIGGYGVHAAKVARTGVPFYLSHTIVRAEGTDHVTGAVIAEVGPDFKPIAGTEQHLDVDTICLAVGLSPMSNLALMAGCAMTNCGGNVPVRDNYGATSVDGIYAAGDVGGIAEASSAMIEGRIAALGVARRGGYMEESTCQEKFTLYQQDLEKLQSGMFAPGSPNKLTVTETAEGYPLSENLLQKGYLTEKELQAYPDRMDTLTGIHPVIECTQNIPCNPCQDICPKQCIEIGDDITRLPSINRERDCIGCGLCVANCPGQAIFLVNQGKDIDTVTLPYEFLPQPKVGDTGRGCDRSGQVVCEAIVVTIKDLAVNDHTLLVTLAVPAGEGNRVRFYKEKGE